MRKRIVKWNKSGPKKNPAQNKFLPSERAETKQRFLEEYAKEGIAIQKAANAVGVKSRQHIYKWAESDPEFAQALEKIRVVKKASRYKNGKITWEELHEHDEEYKKKFLELYADEKHCVASALEAISPHLSKTEVEYWTRSDFEFKKEYVRLQQLIRPTLVNSKKITKLVQQSKLAKRQERFLNLFRENHFNITNTCNVMGVRRQTVRDWCKKNPDFASALEVLQDEKEDYIEDKLFQQIDNGNIAAIIFASKCQLQKPNFGRRTGYVEVPQQRTLTVKHEYNKEMIDAVVRAAELSTGDMFQIPSQKQLPEAIDAEYTTNE